jgi:RHS repeat-associated protein
VRSGVVVQTPELLVHDLDGNLVRDGRWLYSWDAENRLVRVTSSGSRDLRRVDWMYDALGRRVRQVRYVWTNSTWQVVEDLKLVSDPVWFGRHIAELNGTNGAVVRSYVWGLDLSESLDGAGGVGGLLWVRLSGGPAAGVHFVTYDGNGNVWTLVSASTGTETARYEYGPFGEPLRLTGAAAGSNPFRFSTKCQVDATGLFFFGYRFYIPTTGRWPTRDPINELGHRTLCPNRSNNIRLDAGNLYEFVGNNPLTHIDPFGLIKYEGCEGKEEYLQEQFNTYCQKVKDPAFANCLGCSLHAKTNVTRLKHRCDNADDVLHGIKITCEQHDKGLCKGACGWSIVGGNTIRICPAQWSNPKCGQPGCTLMHELTHMVGYPSEKWPKNVEICLGCR